MRRTWNDLEKANLCSEILASAKVTRKTSDYSRDHFWTRLLCTCY